MYGSYLQSKMAEKGVSCTNCHDPHTSKLAIPQEAVCAQCHIPTEFSPEIHTFHKADSEASQCVTCHMPETTYMQVDPRRDHSWQIPRPDLSEHLGTPNVCTDCHTDQTNQWAAQQVRAWFPDSPRYKERHFAIAFMPRISAIVAQKMPCHLPLKMPIRAILFALQPCLVWRPIQVRTPR
ncbi:probable deca-heme c-type cytochrome [Vibrio ishigakensis]|uniref:Probable deca-heme c-type cytochrome n=1 Tax=Vibrio ishigakensis TaxID=1481914 RepID=A0A0B8PCX5_9VIBR|nr:probable deca-heme c-type cytochrome [Vibrio ishigakensis]